MRINIHTEVDGLANVGDKAEDVSFLMMIDTKEGARGSPAPKVHLDFAPDGTRMHLRKYHPRTSELAALTIKAEEKLLSAGVPLAELPDKYDGPRWAMFSVWRPLKTVKRDPLALSDVRSFPQEDYVDYDVLFPTGVDDGSTTHAEASFIPYGSDIHAWHWISNQEPDEVLVIQLFGSEAGYCWWCGAF